MTAPETPEPSRAFQNSPRAFQNARTLSGAGGAKFFNIAGVKYPENAVAAALPAARGSMRNPLDHAPADHITTDEVRAMMNNTTRANVRSVLHRRGIVPVYVREVSETAARAYWPAAEVRAYIDSRPTFGEAPAGWLNAEQAMTETIFSRTSLQRLAAAGRITSRKIITTVGGVQRARVYFLAADLRRADAKQRAYLQRMKEAAQFKP